VRERLLRLVEDGQFTVRRLVVRPPGAHPLGAPSEDPSRAASERDGHGHW
jgi:hypothetical protein